MRCAIVPLFPLLLSTAAAWSAPAAPALLPPSSPYAATNAGQFAALCKVDQGGCADIVGNVLMDKILYSSTHICLPGVNYADGVAPWLVAHPETANMPVADGITLALTSIYKCGPPNNY